MTKATVLYLSYTGNTKRIAEAIHKGVAGVVESCDIGHLRATELRGVARYDLVGIGSPVRLGKMPVEFSDFIVRMDPGDGKHCSVFNTHGALPVDFMRDAVGALTGKGFVVIGSGTGTPQSIFPTCRNRTSPTAIRTRST
jgi:flavodoxin